jgi:hypothetical protein
MALVTEELSAHGQQMTALECYQMASLAALNAENSAAGPMRTRWDQTAGEWLGLAVALRALDAQEISLLAKWACDESP